MLTHTIFGTTIAKHITFIKTIVKITLFFLGTKNFFELPLLGCLNFILSLHNKVVYYSYRRITN